MDALIAQTEALSWEDPSSQLESLPSVPVIEECLPLYGHVIPQKTHNNQSINATLIKAWNFAVPFSFAILGLNKFLFKSSKQANNDKILKLVTWNVNGSLLTLQQWSPSATLGELTAKKFPFWIEVHGLPLVNMLLWNAIAIGKGLGNLIKVDDACAVGLTFRSYLKMLVEVDVFEPLKPDFPFIEKKVRLFGSL